MATYQSGNVRRATPNTVTAMIRSAETRKCPRCGRKSALKWLPASEYPRLGCYCRWEDCGYDKVRYADLETYEEMSARVAEREAARRSSESLA